MDEDVTNINEFTANLKIEAADINQRTVNYVKYIAFETLRRLVLKTPVDTGRARSSWQIGISDVTTDIWLDDPLIEGMKKLQEIKEFDIIYIYNNVFYTYYLEHGHSKQAPNGMVAITVEEINQMPVPENIMPVVFSFTMYEVPKDQRETYGKGMQSNP
jgi:hypothetical protein